MLMSSLSHFSSLPRVCWPHSFLLQMNFPMWPRKVCKWPSRLTLVLLSSHRGKRAFVFPDTGLGGGLASTLHRSGTQGRPTACALTVLLSRRGRGKAEQLLSVPHHICLAFAPSLFTCHTAKFQPFYCSPEGLVCLL